MQKKILTIVLLLTSIFSLNFEKVTTAEAISVAEPYLVSLMSVSPSMSYSNGKINWTATMIGNTSTANISAVSTANVTETVSQNYERTFS